MGFWLSGDCSLPVKKQGLWKILLGLFAGIILGSTSTVYYIEWVAEQKRKKQEQAIKVTISALDKVIMAIKQHQEGYSLEMQLQDAIARDDFEEAARIRDLMNKK